MAKKKLNKKVAIIGIVVLALLLMAAIVTFLRLGQNYEELLKDAEAAYAVKDYETAEENYKKCSASRWNGHRLCKCCN